MRRLNGALLAAILLASSAANAAPPPARPRPFPPKISKAVCIAAHEEGLKLRTSKQPHAAHEKFVQCANDGCPVVVRKECAELVAATDKDAPTVALEARDDQGNDTSSVTVSLDGASIATKLTGVAIDVEPGEHVFKFERDDGKSIEQKVLVVEGEKNRKIAADFSTLLPKKEGVAPPPPPPPPGTKKSISPVVWVAGGVGVLALGSFSIFAIKGKGDEHDLAGTCSPHCDDSQVSPVHRDYLIADISLGVAAVSAAIAVYFLVAQPQVGITPAARPWMPKIRIKP